MSDGPDIVLSVTYIFDPDAEEEALRIFFWRYCVSVRGHRYEGYTVDLQSALAKANKQMTLKLKALNMLED